MINITQTTLGECQDSSTQTVEVIDRGNRMIKVAASQLCSILQIGRDHQLLFEENVCSIRILNTGLEELDAPNRGTSGNAHPTISRELVDEVHKLNLVNFSDPVKLQSAIDTLKNPEKLFASEIDRLNLRIDLKRNIFGLKVSENAYVFKFPS